MADSDPSPTVVVIPSPFEAPPMIFPIICRIVLRMMAESHDSVVIIFLKFTVLTKEQMEMMMMLQQIACKQGLSNGGFQFPILIILLAQLSVF